MKSLEELKAIRERMQGQIGMRSEHAKDTRVVVGMATCGIASGARPVLNTLVNEEKAKEIVEQHLIRGQVVDKYLLHMDENM